MLADDYIMKIDQDARNVTDAIMRCSGEGLEVSQDLLVEAKRIIALAQSELANPSYPYSPDNVRFLRFYIDLFTALINQ